MGRPKKMKYEDQLFQKFNGKIKNIEEYVNLNTKILHRCNVHDYEFSSSPACVLNSKQGCPKCGEEARIEFNKKRIAFTTEEYSQKLFEKYNGKIICIGEFKGTNKKTEHYCLEHDYKYTSTPDAVLSAKHGCRYCAGDNPKKSSEEKINNIKKRIFELTGNEYEAVIPDDFDNADYKRSIKFKHNCDNGEIHYFYMTIDHFIYRSGRCYCQSGAINKVIKGYNDIHTTNPRFADCMVDKEKSYELTMASKEPIKLKCPDCGNIFEKKPCNVRNNKLSCPFCSDGFSYPNKFIFNSLIQIKDDLDFMQREYRPDWCHFEYDGSDRVGIYDIYIGVDNKGYIIEMDGGIGHGNKLYATSKLSVEDTIEIDKIKNKLANEHGIEVIRIDCYYDADNQYSFIKKNIENSKLSNILDLSKIDFELSNENSIKSCVSRVAELWNEGKTVGEIRKLLKLGENTVSSYLRRATSIGICDYTKEKSQERSRYVKVVCITTRKAFKSLTDAAKFYATRRMDIKSCCDGKREYSGTYNSEKLKWMFYEDYIEKYGESTLLSNDGLSA